MLPNASKYECFSYTPGSAHVAAGLSDSADPSWPGVLGVWGGGVQELGDIQVEGWLKAKARGGGW